jgi:hypothetical protein
LQEVQQLLLHQLLRGHSTLSASTTRARYTLAPHRLRRALDFIQSNLHCRHRAERHRRGGRAVGLPLRSQFSPGDRGVALRLPAPAAGCVRAASAHGPEAVARGDRATVRVRQPQPVLAHLQAGHGRQPEQLPLAALAGSRKPAPEAASCALQRQTEHEVGRERIGVLYRGVRLGGGASPSAGTSASSISIVVTTPNAVPCPGRDRRRLGRGEPVQPAQRLPCRVVDQVAGRASVRLRNSAGRA